MLETIGLNPEFITEAKKIAEQFLSIKLEILNGRK
jgi:hypothetical protein